MAALIDRYVERAGYLAPLEVTVVRGSRSSEPSTRSREDAGALQRAARGDLTMLLSPRGRTLSSEDLAQWLARRLVGASQGTSFAVAGEGGLLPDDERWAEERLALSAMTLPHELARVILAEQLYRALTIIRNHKYHK